MKVIKYVLNYKWYDMIEAGLKPEEYRDIKGSIVSQLFNWKATGWSREDVTQELKTLPNSDLWDFQYESDSIEFYRGYSKDRKTMLWEFKELTIGKAVPEWSGNWQGNVFIHKLGKRIK